MSTTTEPTGRLKSDLAAAVRTADQIDYWIRRHCHSVLLRNASRSEQVESRRANDALRRPSNEVEHRPLVTVAVAVGVGILVGLASGSVAAGLTRPLRPTGEQCPASN